MPERKLLIAFYVVILTTICCIASAAALYFFGGLISSTQAESTPNPTQILQATYATPPVSPPLPELSPTPLPSATTQSTATIPPTATLSPTPSLPRLGETVESNGYSLTAITLENPTRPGILYEAKPGFKLVGVEIIVGNTGGEQITVNPLDAVLLDSEGFTYTAALGDSENDQIEMVDLNPGEKVKGWIAFEIPEGAEPFRLKYEFSGYPQIVIETGLH